MAGIQRIGVLTGGGDCPGLNAVIRAVAKDAIFNEIEVVGIEDGFLGVIENRYRRLEYEDVSNILTVGGTILGSSNKADPLRFPVGTSEDGSPVFENRLDESVENLRRLELDALVCIGGDGTMSCASSFVERGINCIGVPKTIDNDIVGTDLTFGFLTAVNTATDAIDRVHTTAASHHRAMVVEVMGRHAGWIALHSGIASGSDVILIPEIPFSIEHVCKVVLDRSKRGKRYTVICIAEGATPRGGEQIVERVDETSPDPIRLGGVSKWLADRIEDETGVESRYVVLGHVQRGGSPIPADRVLATEFGDHAMTLLLRGERNRMVALQRGELTSVDIATPAHKQRRIPPDHPLLAAARSVYTSFGD